MDRKLHLFEGYGVELEYMIVDRDTLDVLPVADQVLRAANGGGEWVGEVERGDISWSNELVLHVIELKTTGPVATLTGLAERFQENIREIHRLLLPLHGRLMPGGMHPWMNPELEMRLWPHDHGPVYQAFDRIFCCRGHGWSNLQSAHLNLPFGNDEEFGRLHAAIRLVLPLLPALAASSPIYDRRQTGLLDNRLEVYRNNARRVPAVSGRVIPEPVFSRDEYAVKILGEIYREMEPLDPEGVLRHEWVNARGAIARFDRQTIEIRVLDVQENPEVDLALLQLIIALVRGLVEERWSSLADQQQWPVAPLEEIFLEGIARGDQGIIRDEAYLRLFGYSDHRGVLFGEFWLNMLRQLLLSDAALRPQQALLEHRVRRGPLARSILAALGGDAGEDNLKKTYQRLCACLSDQMLF